VGGKTVWDWLSLLLIPLLIGTIFVTNRQTDAQNALSAQLHQSDQAQHQHDAKLAQEARWDDLLRQYRDSIDNLLFYNGLRHAHPGDDVSEIAHARTLDILGAVDPSRRGLVINYLSNLGLIQGGFWDKGQWHPAKVNVSLSEANLKGADLAGANLEGVDLHFADLEEAHLSNAALNGADLGWTHLSNATLNEADLRWIALDEADLSSAVLNQANLKWARLTPYQLHSVSSLSGSILPNGFHCQEVSATDQFNMKKQAENRDACVAHYLKTAP
jgi:hypothetical protein